MATFNTMLNILKKESDFFMLNQIIISAADLWGILLMFIKSFFNGEWDYPRFKSKKHDKTTFRIENNDNIKINTNAIVLLKSGGI